MSHYTEKLRIIQKKFGSVDPEANLLVRQWRDRMGYLQVSEAWLAVPNTQQMRELAETIIAAINEKLANDEKLTDLERAGYFGEKRAHLAYLALLTIDPKKEMEALESEIEDKANYAKTLP